MLFLNSTDPSEFRPNLKLSYLPLQLPSEFVSVRYHHRRHRHCLHDSTLPCAVGTFQIKHISDDVASQILPPTTATTLAYSLILQTH